jgi:hypothetical protein
LTDGLKQLLAAKEVKKIAKLKETAEKALGAFGYGRAVAYQRLGLCQQPQNESTLSRQDFALAVLEPLDLACRSRLAPLVVIALDCLGKLLAYNYFGTLLSGTADDTVNASRRASVVDMELDGPVQSDSSGDQSLMDRIVDIIYDSFTGESTDDKVQLQIFKVDFYLLTALTVCLGAASRRSRKRSAVIGHSSSDAPKSRPNSLQYLFAHKETVKSSRRPEHFGANDGSHFWPLQSSRTVQG